MTEQTASSTFLAERFKASSQVGSALYVPDLRELRAVFKGSPAVLYAYQDVPPEVWTGLLTAPSIGSYFHTAVKAAGYSFERRVDPQQLRSQAIDFAALLASDGNNAAVDNNQSSEAQPEPEGDEDDGSSDLVDEVIEGAAAFEAGTETAGNGAVDSEVQPAGGDFGGGGATGDFSAPSDGAETDKTEGGDPVSNDAGDADAGLADTADTSSDS